MGGVLVPKVPWGYINGVLGPLSTSIGGIKLLMKTSIEAKPWLDEPSLVSLPWREDFPQGSWTKKLKVGIMWDDGVVTPHPPIVRALREVVEKLQHVPGVEVVTWKPYKHDLAWEIIVKHFH